MDASNSGHNVRDSTKIKAYGPATKAKINLKRKLLDMEAERKGLLATVDNLNGRVATLETEKTNLETEKTNLNGRVATLETEKTNLNGRVATLETEKTNLINAEKKKVEKLQHCMKRVRVGLEKDLGDEEKAQEVAFKYVAPTLGKNDRPMKEGMIELITPMVKSKDKKVITKMWKMHRESKLSSMNN